MGVDVFSGGVTNILEEGVIEPVWVKQQALKSATEAASMILRIDDVIALTKPKAEACLPERKNRLRRVLNARAFYNFLRMERVNRLERY